MCAVRKIERVGGSRVVPGHAIPGYAGGPPAQEGVKRP